MTDIRRVYEIDAKLGADALASLKAIQQAMKGVEDTAAKTKKSLGGLTDVFGAFSGKAGGIAALGQVLGGIKSSFGILTEVPKFFFDINTSILETQSTLERLRLGFTTLNPQGGIAAAGQELDYVRKISLQLGVDFNKAAEAYVKLGAASKGTLLEGKNTRDVFESISLASRNLGLSTLQTENAFRAIQQVISKGVLQQEELRGQLSEALPGAFQIAARAMGVTQTELNKLIKEGQVFADDFVPKFAAQIRKELGGTIPEGLNDATLALNRFKSAYEQLAQSITDAGVAKAAANLRNALSEEFEAISEAIRKATKEQKGFVAALLEGVKASLALSEARNRKAFGLEPEVKINLDTASVKELEDEAKRLKELLSEAASKRNVAETAVRVESQPIAKRSLQQDVDKALKEEIRLNKDLNDVLAARQRIGSAEGRREIDESGFGAEAKALTAAIGAADRALAALDKEFKNTETNRLAERKRLLTQLDIAKTSPELANDVKRQKELYDAIIKATEAKGDGVKLENQQIKSAKSLNEALTEQLNVLRELQAQAGKNEDAYDTPIRKLVKQREALNQEVEKVLKSGNTKALDILIDAEEKLNTLERETPAAEAFKVRIEAQKKLAEETQATLAAVRQENDVLEEAIDIGKRGAEATAELAVRKLELKAASIAEMLATSDSSIANEKLQSQFETLLIEYRKLIAAKKTLATTTRENKRIDEVQKDIQDVTQETAAIAAQLEIYGKSKDAIAQFEIAKVRLKKARIDEVLATSDESLANEKYRAELEELSKRYAILIEQKEKLRSESIRDELLANFSDSKDLGDAFAKTLKDELRKRVFEITIKPITDPFVKLIKEATDEITAYLTQELKKVFRDQSLQGAVGGLFEKIAGFFGFSGGGGSSGSSVGFGIPGGVELAQGGVMSAAGNVSLPARLFAQGGVMAPAAAPVARYFALGGTMAAPAARNAPSGPRNVSIRAFTGGGIMTRFGNLMPEFSSRGGIANRPRLAVFGEGRHREAYIPMEDNRTVPVVIQRINSQIKAYVPLPSGQIIPVSIRDTSDVKSAYMKLPDGNRMPVGRPATEESAPIIGGISVGGDGAGVSAPSGGGSSGGGAAPSSGFAFGGIMSDVGPIRTFEKGGVMSSVGPIRAFAMGGIGGDKEPVRAYAFGGVAGTTGSQAYVPMPDGGAQQSWKTSRDKDEGSKGGTVVIIETHGAEVTERREKTNDGREQLRFIIDATKSAVADDINSGGVVDRALATKYPGLSRGSGTPRLAR